MRTTHTALILIALSVVSSVAHAQRGVDPFTAPPFHPSGIDRIPNLPIATIELVTLREIRCAVVPTLRTSEQVADDLTDLISGTSGDPPTSVAAALGDALTQHRWDRARYRRALRTLDTATNFRSKHAALQRVARGIGIPAWERCGRPNLADRSTQDCIRAHGAARIAQLSPTERATAAADSDVLTASLHDTVYWLSFAYCTWFSEAHQVKWADAVANLQSSPITWLLQHPREFCDGVKTLVQEGFCSLVMTGRGMGVRGEALQGACRALTGPMRNLGYFTGSAAGGRWLNQNFLERSESGVAVGNLAFDLTAFGCKKLLTSTCKWLTDAPARRERDRCVADLEQLRTSLERRDAVAAPRTIEHLEQLLRQRGRSLDE